MQAKVSGLCHQPVLGSVKGLIAEVMTLVRGTMTWKDKKPESEKEPVILFITTHSSGD